MCWVLQIASGFLLLGLLSYGLDVQFSELIRISVSGNYFFVTRAFHMLGSNFCLILLLIHQSKAVSGFRILSAEKFLLWLLSSVLLVLSLGLAFSGYVLVCGNMSF